jgi:hypothetical protein
MSNTITPFRPAMTALAAVIALSSTPLLAQATEGAASQAAPVIVPAPTIVPPAVAQTATPDASVAAAVENAQAPQPVMRTMSTPVIHTEDAPEVSQAAPQRIVPVKRSSATAIKAAPVETAAIKPQPTAPAAAPVARVAALTAPANAAPVTKAASVQTTSALSLDDEVVPIAIGLGLIVLGGGAFAFSRRRRHEDEDELVLEETPAEAATMVTPEPIMVVPKAPAPMAAGSSTLSNGFDISRFGRHAQAAYRGPTPDNPSFSLKRRLSRASFFDQREREAALAGAPVAAERAAPVAAAKAKHEQDNGQVTVRLAPQRQSGSFGYVFQK